MRERSIRFHERWYGMISGMDNATRLKVYDMIMGYAFNGSVPTDTDLSLLFLSVKAEIDEDRKREEEISDINRKNVLKRWHKDGMTVTGRELLESLHKDDTMVYKSIKDANDTTVYDRIRPNTNDTTVYDRIKNKPQSTQSPTEIKEEKERSKEKEEFINNNININNNNINNIEEEDKEEEITSVRPQVLPQPTGGAVAPAAAPATEASYLASVMDNWNERMKGVGIPSIVAIGGNRRAHVLARMREYGVEAVAKVIDMVATSRFLQGSNNRGFVATFDWVIKPANFIKILEGNYNETYDRNERNALDALRSVINESNGTDADVLNW